MKDYFFILNVLSKFVKWESQTFQLLPAGKKCYLKPPFVGSEYIPSKSKGIRAARRLQLFDRVQQLCIFCFSE